MVVEAEGLPTGSFLPVHTAPLVAYEANLEKDKEMVGQFHDKARTDAKIVVIARGRSAIIGPSPEIVADIGIQIRNIGREGGMQSEIGMDVDDRTGALAGIDHESAGNAHAEMFVKNMAEFGGNAEYIAASPGMHPADADAGIVPVLRKDAFFGAPQALGMDTSACDKQRNNEDYLLHGCKFLSVNVINKLSHNLCRDISTVSGLGCGVCKDGADNAVLRSIGREETGEGGSVLVAAFAV